MKIFKTLETRRKYCEVVTKINFILLYICLCVIAYLLTSILEMYASLVNDGVQLTALFGPFSVCVLGGIILFIVVVSFLLISIRGELSSIEYHLRFVSPSTKMREEDN